MRAGVLALLAVSACTSIKRVDFPELSSGDAKSALLVFGDAEQSPFGVAIDLVNDGTPVTSVSIDEATELYLLFFDATLAELQLTAGALSPPGAGQPARPLPAAAYAYAYDRALSSWAVRTSTIAALADHRLPAPSAADCGGCVRRRASFEYCEVPCTAGDWRAQLVPPRAPEAPSFMPCPSGWLASSGACRPPPRADCPNGQVQPIDQPACEELGDPCPAGELPVDLPPDALIVRARGAGRCTNNESPFCSLAAALANAEDGATIVLGKGAHRGGVVIDRPLTLRGACASETIVRSSTRAPAELLIFSTAALAIDNLSFEPGGEIAIHASSSPLALSRVSTAGTIMIGESLVADRLSAGTLDLFDRARAELDRSLLSNVHSGDGASLSLRDVVVSGASANGILAYSSSISIERGLIERSGHDGIQAYDSDLTLYDVVFADNGGSGVYPLRGRLRGARVIFERNGIAGLAADDVLTVELTDVWAAGNAQSGLGLEAVEDISIARAVVASNAKFGILAALLDTSARISLSDVAVAGTYRAEVDHGVAISVRGTGLFRLERAVIESNDGTGVELFSNGGVVIDDVVVRRCKEGGISITCNRSHAPNCPTVVPRAIIERAVIDTIASDALYAESSVIEISDALITRTTTGTAIPNRLSSGVRTYSDSDVPGHVDADRFLIRENYYGVYIAPGGTVLLRRGEISASDTGVYVIPSGFEPASIGEQVIFRDNRLNVGGP